MKGHIVPDRMRPHMSASESVVSMMDLKQAVTTCRRAGGPMPTGMEGSVTRVSQDGRLMITATDSAKATNVHFATADTVIMIGAERPRRRRARLGPGSLLESFGRELQRVSILALRSRG
jgi:hypothetical protein